MEYEISKKLDLIVKSIPLFTGYLFFVGTLNEIIFYGLFHINILQYISLSEAILFSLNYLIPASISILAGIATGTLLSRRRLKKTITPVEIKKLDSFDRRIDSFSFFFPIVIEGVLFLYTLCTNTKVTWCFFILATILLGIVILGVHYLKKALSLDRVDWAVIISIILFTSLITCFSCSNGILIRYGVRNYDCAITMKENKNLKSSDSLFYIGKSDKYVFLFNKFSEGPEILTIDQIIEIKWVKNKTKFSWMYSTLPLY